MLNRKGFTLIELLIVVVIIGILAAIAIPKFAATKDKAKLTSVKTYASLSSGNTATVAGVASGFTTTVSNSSISTGYTKCQVQVGAGAASTVDGVITCS